MSLDNIEVVNHTDESGLESLFKLKWLGSVFKELGLLKPSSLNILTDKQLLEVNQQSLNHDYYTDVITFDYTDDEDIEQNEILISIDRIKENAQANNATVTKEIHRIAIHGMLHLSGLNDATSSEKEKMTSEENRLLALYCST